MHCKHNRCSAKIPTSFHLERARPALKHMSSSEPLRQYTLSDFDFQLPPELIAQHPSPERSGSRLLDARDPLHLTTHVFRALPDLLSPGDLLVFNDTQVVNARLFGEKTSGGQLKLLIERVLPDEANAPANRVVAHMKVSKKPLPGARLTMWDRTGRRHAFDATLLGRWPDDNGALFLLSLSDDPHRLMAAHGHMPLPPYIERQQKTASDTDRAQDAQRYQTVFAKHPGSAAAPTAALHFDEALIQRLTALGVQQASVTLHVGAGTFSPVKTEDLSAHRMHSEWYHMPASTVKAIADCRERGGRVVAVGTTSVRTLESWAQTGLSEGDTRIFITPGFDFKVVDLLVTNFHLPKSTLLMLVAAFSGFEHMHRIYQYAMAQKYRFFSYGDAMLLKKLKS